MTEREIFFRHLGLPSFQPLGLEIEKAEGIWIWDTSGKKYMDLVSGISVSNVGHRHPAVIRTIHDQLEKYLHVNVYGEFIQSPQNRLAEKLAGILPDTLDAVYFVNSGSEAVEGAIKLAKRYTGRTEVISFKNAYHGSTMGALSVLGNETLKNAFRPLIPGGRILKFNDYCSLEMITHHTACVIVESIQAEAGVIIPDECYLYILRKKCNETGTLLILDDVQLGFGRTGKMFSFEHFDFVPDILVLAKAMGGGMPLGAFISSREIMNALASNPELGHITTFGGHPVSCAAALASLEVILSEKLHEKAEEKGRMFEERLTGIPAIKKIHRKGLILGIELQDPSIRSHLTILLLTSSIIIDWFLFPPATFRIAPPLTISEEEIELACKLITEGLS
jgi:acetylornithine/N-succinyldiaminopimelate aminotransferase